jgi:TolB-like protein/tetratricopeptide (TPR) repeat protein
MDGERNFFSELKRRNVYKVAVAYAVVGWLVIQIATSTFPVLEIPNWAAKLVIAVVLLGFPIALVIAWAFEMTPEGMKRTEEVAPDEKIPQWSARKFAALIATVAVLAAGLLCYQILRPKMTVAPAAIAVPEKSVAVLPFENLSSDKENSYFADGIQDEILTRIARIGDLKVISRTSTEKYRGRAGNLKAIAEELGVAALLEGSVQKSGGKVRVIVQLIAARSDDHLWAQTYDRSLDDIFAVQSEIAGQVASALHASLTPQESVALKNVPTRNQKAYDLFLRAEYIFRIAHDNFAIGNLPEAIELYRQAIVEDPRFALADARLSWAESLLRWLGGAPKDGSPDQSRANADKAIALQPDLVEAHLALAFCEFYGRFDYPRALEHLANASALAPNNTEVLTALGGVYRRQLRFKEAIDVMERAAQFDPGNPNLFLNLGSTYLWGQRFEKVQPNYERALALNPEYDGAAVRLARFFIEQRGDVDGARAILRTRIPRLQLFLTNTYSLTRDYKEAERLIEELPANSPAFSQISKEEGLGIVLYYAGQRERARAFLEPVRSRYIASLADKTVQSRQFMFDSARLAFIEVALGNFDAGVQVAERGAQSEAVARDPIQGAIYRRDLAAVYALAGRKDAAIALISELINSIPASSGVTTHTLRLDPDWDSLRDDPRFQALLSNGRGATDRP